MGGMSDPTDLPFQEPAPGEAPRSSSQPPRPDVPVEQPEQTETDLLAARVSGPEDHEGMTALWRATMGLPHWWFIAVGDEGQESPAAAEIDGQLMLMTFTNGDRARHFAVQNGMIEAQEDMPAIALTPEQVVESAGVYEDAGIAGLMFDPHLTGYFAPTGQLPILWDAIHHDPEAAPEG